MIVSALTAYAAPQDGLGLGRDRRAGVRHGHPALHQPPAADWARRCAGLFADPAASCGCSTSRWRCCWSPRSRPCYSSVSAPVEREPGQAHGSSFPKRLSARRDRRGRRGATRAPARAARSMGEGVGTCATRRYRASAARPSDGQKQAREDGSGQSASCRQVKNVDGPPPRGDRAQIYNRWSPSRGERVAFVRAPLGSGET